MTYEHPPLEYRIAKTAYAIRMADRRRWRALQRGDETEAASAASSLAFYRSHMTTLKHERASCLSRISAE